MPSVSKYVRQNGAVDQMFSTLGMPMRMRARFFQASGLERLNFRSTGVRRTLVSVRLTSTSIFFAPSSGIGRWS